MSDRQRRWICRMIFMVVCLLPTTWFLARVAWQPTAPQWSSQLQLVLGIPLQVGSLQTPDPQTIRLLDLRWEHPELHWIAEIDQLEIRQTHVATTDSNKWNQTSVLPQQHWTIRRLVVSEQGLSEFLDTLHHQWLQLQKSRRLPELQIDELFVIRTSGNPEVDSQLLARLGSLVIHEVSSAETEEREALPAALVIQGKVLPRTGGTLIGGIPRRDLAAADFQFHIQRRAQGYQDFLTRCDLNIEQPLPLTWLDFDTLPQVLVDHSFCIQGQLSAWWDRRKSTIKIHDARLLGGDSARSDGEFQLSHLLDWTFGPTFRSWSQLGNSGLAARTGALPPLRGNAQLKIKTAELETSPGRSLELVYLDADLLAKDGEIADPLLRKLQTELGNNVPRSPAPLTGFVEFDDLSIRLLAQKQRITLRPLEGQETFNLITFRSQPLLTATSAEFPLKNFFLPVDQPQNAFQMVCRLLPKPEMLLPPDREADWPESSTQQASHQEDP